ncbi:MAG: FeoA domain protein [Pelotomaculum sp. PtaU1.Bin035]|nr:MAG: FeoA domain protein [Pelotomaculum sp. PtaU1.Bin035]
MIMRLNNVLKGKKVYLHTIDDCPDGRKRLEELGFTPGTLLVVCDSRRKGPMVVSIRGGKYMLGEEVAEKIVVRCEL